jgi:hypothetical protein
MRRRIHACHVSYEEEDTFIISMHWATVILRGAVIWGGGYTHAMCHMRRRIPSSFLCTEPPWYCGALSASPHTANKRRSLFFFHVKGCSCTRTPLPGTSCSAPRTRRSCAVQTPLLSSVSVCVMGDGWCVMYDVWWVMGGVCVYVCMYACMYIYMERERECVCVCMYVCVCVYIYIQIHIYVDPLGIILFPWANILCKCPRARVKIQA